MPPPALRSAMIRVQLRSRVELPAAGVALKHRDARLGVRHHDVHRHAGRDRPERRDVHTAGTSVWPDSDEPMATIVRRRSPLLPEVVRIDRAVEERDLIVVGVVECLRQRVADAEAVAPAERPIERQQQRVVLRLGARLDVHDAIGSADNGVEDLADGAADQEVDALVVHHVDARAQCRRCALLDADMELVHRSGSAGAGR